MKKNFIACKLGILIFSLLLFSLFKITAMPYDTTLANYTKKDKEINEQLKIIFKELAKKVPQYNVNDTTFAWDETLCFDGIFPNYSNQNIKILFLAREARGLAGFNYIDECYEGIQNKTIGDIPINKSAFFRRQMKIAYGLNKDVQWDTIPSPSEMNFPDDVSFAIMEFSKISNEDKSWKTDLDRFNCFVDTVSVQYKDFWSNEIEIINPDIIIGMNINSLGENYYGKLGQIDEIDLSDCNLSKNFAAFWLSLPNGRRIFLIDTYHFSSQFKSDKRDFYDPICEVFKKHKSDILSARGIYESAYTKRLQTILDSIKKTGKAPDGCYKSTGHTFNNFEKKLPPTTVYKEYGIDPSYGKKMEKYNKLYHIWEINKNGPEPIRPDPGPIRIIIGENGSAYITKDHYKTFTLIK